jgi:DNA-binding NarL/FixJ family response regulator
MTDLRQRLLDAGVEPLAELGRIAARPDTPVEKAIEILLMIQARIDSDEERKIGSSPTPEPKQLAASFPSPGRPVERQIKRRNRRAVGRLSVSDTIDVMRACADGLDRKDIAELMSVTPQTIHNIMRRSTMTAQEAGRQWDVIRAAAQKSYAVGGVSRPLNAAS